MKLHRSTTSAVIEALGRIFIENRYADKVIEKTLKQDTRWGARDRRFIAETTYDIVRWHRLLQKVAGCGEHDFWKLFAAWCFMRFIPLPDWEEFRKSDPKEMTARLKSAEAVRKIIESIPDWMDERGEKELGKLWDRELKALNEEAVVVLRANTLKISRDDLSAALEKESVETTFPNGYPEALVLKQRQNVFQLPAFKEGLFELQDAGSQAIVPFLRVSPGMRVIDACAGAGGKTLHLAAITQNRGRIIALDTEDWKLEELKKRARRAGASNIETRVITSSKVIKRMENSADRLLLDVPCSGLGVLKRNPDAKWKVMPEFIDRVMELQQHILNDYVSMLKPGGLLVYSTCSLLPSENESQVQQFLEKHGAQFRLLEEKKILPSEGFDGFYMALIEKNK